MKTDRVQYLVTGGAGFIGSHIVEQLVQDGHGVRVIDNLSTGHERNLAGWIDDIEFLHADLRDPQACRRAVEGIDVVFHVAALPSVPRSLADPWASHDSNVNGTVNLLLACREAGVRRVVYSSSSSAYGDTPALPKVESMEPLPRSPYAAAKLAAEHYVLAFARAGLVEGVALRYFNVFGPRQDPNSAYAAVIPAFLKAARDGSPARLFGDGGQTRDFTFVSNVVNANLLAGRQDASRASGWVVNVGAGARTSLLELLTMIEELSNRKVTIEHAPSRPGDVRDSLASLDRARQVLDYAAAVPLRAGLERTWGWFVHEEPTWTSLSA
jgi:UDP-glucose 4-epimerase